MYQVSRNWWDLLSLQLHNVFSFSLLYDILIITNMEMKK